MEKKVIEIFERDVRVIFAGKKRYISGLYEHGLKSYLNGTSIVNPNIAFSFWKSLEEKDQNKTEYILENIEDPFGTKLLLSSDGIDQIKRYFKPLV